MTAFPGFDSYAPPRPEDMAALKVMGMRWCGFYLAPAPSHQSPAWMGHRAALVAAGWGILPIYVGQQIVGPGSHIITDEQGRIDGRAAALMMGAEGFPPGRFIYLDLENGAPLSDPQAGYVSAWGGAVRARGFEAGVYCSHGIASAVQALSPDTRIWAYKIATTDRHPAAIPFWTAAPSGSGFPGAFAWQREQNASVAVNGRTLILDISVARTADPSAP